VKNWFRCRATLPGEVNENARAIVPPSSDNIVSFAKQFMIASIIRPTFPQQKDESFNM
jgi:hypothetical protein